MTGTDPHVLLAVFVVALGVTALARRWAISAPLLLVVVGLAASFVPGVPVVPLDPDLVLFLVLPPLLYSAALQSSTLRLRENLRRISQLAVGLVVFTTAVVGLAAWLLVPELPLASALVLGAVVAPPDAVAAASIGRRLGLPRRIMTILEGESLLNDATALTLFRVLLAAALSTTIGTGTTILHGLEEFALAAVGGVLIGAVAGFVLHRVRLRLADEALESSVGLLVPFAIYLLAEELHTSGVLAVVIAGLYLGHKATEAGYATRLQEQAVWKALDTLLEALVFALIGLQLRVVVDGLGEDAARILLVSLALLGVTILARFVWVFPTIYLPRLVPRVRARSPALSWRGPFVISWAGMRGVVTLAAAFAVPAGGPAGPGMPGRDVVLFAAFVITVGTLLVQGLTLPTLIRRLQVRDKDTQRDVLDEAAVKQAAAEAALTRLDELADESTPGHVSEQLRTWAQHRANGAWERLGRSDDEIGEAPSVAFTRVRRAMLVAERETFVRFRDLGRIDEGVLREMLRELDYEEAMLDR
ncbi:Na+/H+ antiporter [Actinomycetospora cinnamomea]|uniref:Sodium/proton antiporter (CPA1 family) n=1 Tax=Actinomycetospora cinnamomea TaxID=663609 RepID=A0A2U1FIT9_9PSEU|nr:Na+/H+ antiporter [Actinomycetospora cinnamomea]PVZ12103.1 sodium/proton antiporter (CPA1 family) [Actinomycetospora cinnamomea]